MLIVRKLDLNILEEGKGGEGGLRRGWGGADIE